MLSIRKSFFLIVLIIFIVAFLSPNTVNAVSETGSTSYNIMDGVIETTAYVTDSGKENVRVHFLRIKKGANTTLKVSSKNYYQPYSNAASRKYAADSWNDSSWGYSQVAEQAANYETCVDSAGQVIAGFNGDFYLDNGQTVGKLIMEGNQVNGSTQEPFFAVLENGSVDIRDGWASTTDVVEAVSGEWLVKNGTVTRSGKSSRESRQAVGITASGDVVFANADNKDPASQGMMLYDLALMMKQQGCVDAINLDGGGSATFLTKRSGDKKLVYRNTTGEFVARGVSSSILVVKNNAPGGNPMPGGYVSMKDSRTKLQKNSKGVYSYIINGKKQKGFINVNGATYLFNNKGAGMNKKVKLGTTTYTFVKGRLAKSSDKKAGRVVMGFCGAGKGGKNMLYSFQYGNKVLNIGLNPLVKKNGYMRNWSNVRYVPWQQEIYTAKTVRIGKGVKNIGTNFMYVATTPFNTYIRKEKPKLKTVVIGDDVTVIGASAFFNQTSIRKITIPKKVTNIWKNGFGRTSGVVFTFKKDTPPKMAKGSFSRYPKAKKHTFKVPKTKKWKAFFKSKKKKTIKFDGKVKYYK